MPFDEEIERINRKKYEELMKRRYSKEANADVPQRPVKPAELSDNDFHQAIGSERLMVVDFWAPWCAPCRVVSPILDELAAEYAGKVAFGKLNVDENPRAASEFGIQGIPTVLIFKDGNAVDGVVGAAPRSQIEARIRQYLGESYSAPSPYQ